MIIISATPLANFVHFLEHPPNPTAPPPLSRSNPPQPTGPLTREYPHDPKPNIKQPQRIRHQPSHAPHPPHRAEHLTAAISAPANRQRADHVPGRRIHRQRHAHATREHERQQAVPQHAGAPGEGQRAGQLAAAAAAHVVVGGLGVGGRGGGGVAVGGRGHEGEDGVEGEGADEGEAVDVAEVDLAGEEEEGAEEEEEEDRSGEVGVVHDVLGDGVEGVEHRERLQKKRHCRQPSCFISQHRSPEGSERSGAEVRRPATASTRCGPRRTLPLMCPKLTPSSSSSGGSPSYPSVPNAAIQPVRNPPCSPMRPLTPCPPKLGAVPKPPALEYACGAGGWP